MNVFYLHIFSRLMGYSIFWFRRDLRLEDNVGLHAALQSGDSVIPIFIFDRQILDRLEDRDDVRVGFIHESLRILQQKLEKEGSTLMVKYGNPLEIWQEIVGEYEINGVYTNHDYEPYAIERDGEVQRLLQKQGIAFHTFKDQVIFEKDEVMKDDGKPYTVFTPYSKKWRKKLNEQPIAVFPSENFLQNFWKHNALPIPSLAEMGFEPSSLLFPERTIRKRIIEAYSDQRDLPGVEGTTRLSVHLRFGTVSIRKLMVLAHELNDTWLSELIWREFYMMILWHFPHVVRGAFKPQYDEIEWKNDVEHFEAWCEGMTGYPFVDAGMRELNATGFMHNRARMITASFLTKHLLVDWRWGERYFARKLLDFELSSNNGGWQWSAGTGCDASPYFRVFNPYLQAKKFDPDNAYISKWIPELGTPAYPEPIVEHSFARKRAIETYKEGLAKEEVLKRV